MGMWTSRSATCPHAHTALRPPPIVAVGFHTKRRGAQLTRSLGPHYEALSEAIEMRIAKKFLLIILAAGLHGCAGLSSVLGITHTETFVANGTMLIVSNENSFQSWAEYAKSIATRAEIIQRQPGSDSILLTNSENNRFAGIVFIKHSPDLCTIANESEAKGQLWELLQQSKLRVSGINKESISNCKSGIPTRHTLNITNDHAGYSNLATAILDVEYKIVRKFNYEPIGLRCKDGTLSRSTGQGTCSWHGGISGVAYRKVYLE
ncbi:MAG: hypothetical protein E6Q30_01330 [Aquabacterium sp.]|nr:MAG: hypothetical protein E6Q30_01330 [Aquabacterium sp.]